MKKMKKQQVLNWCPIIEVLIMLGDHRTEFGEWVGVKPGL
jgi:hypothetical protein